MTRKALLIGSQTGKLTGVVHDVAAMEQALKSWEFTSTRCEAEDASRAGILDAYEGLIANAHEDDAILVYYSGHGGYATRPADTITGAPAREVQFIVPTDFESSVDGDFRGITSVELSLLLARLTERTKNVTVVLDCCHAELMSRDDPGGPMVKSLDREVPFHVVAGHVDSLRLHGRHFDLWKPLGSPYAVRIVACAQQQLALEYTNAKGIRTGMLTEALTTTLSEVRVNELTVSWAAVIDRVRQRVLTLAAGQRPDAEGPAQRLIFDIAESDPVTSLPVGRQAGRLRIGGATFLGVEPGDEFVVMPGEGQGPDDRTKIGDVVVDAVDAQAAWGDLRPRGAEVDLPIGARAYLVRTAAPTLPVELPGDASGLAALVGGIDAAPLIRRAATDEDSPVRVEVDAAGGLTVHDRIGPLHEPRAATDSESVVRDLTRLARASALRRLAAGPGEALSTPVRVEFGVVEDGQARQLPSSGALLYQGQHVYVRVRNDGPGEAYVSLLDIGVSTRVTPLNPAVPSGVQLRAGEEYVYGADDLNRTLPGVALSWPDGVFRGRPRPETIIVLATSQPVDTRALEMQGIRVDGVRGASALEEYLYQLGHGGIRELSPVAAPVRTRFVVRTIDFDLVPAPAPAAEVPVFQVDERPLPGDRILAARGTPPARVALRLSDLVVHHNRAFRGADIRIDTVVITGSGRRQPRFHTSTERFDNVRDGQRLPLDNLLIYHGPVVDYLDIAVWVSRDDGRALALSDMLRDELNGVVQSTLAPLGGLLGDAPQVASAVAAVGASAVVVNTAFRLLQLALGGTIGLYRTTFLAHEGFGVGLPSGRTTVRAQDFSFRYSVEEVLAESDVVRQ